jgi:rSAM/selenodomain-associated transferase 1
MPPPADAATNRAVLLFSKPPVAGRVKTRLIGPLSAEQAARLHAAFLADLAERLSAQRFALVPVWALADGEALPPQPPGGQRQAGGDLGARMRYTFEAFLLGGESGAKAGLAIAIGSDLPQLAPERIEQAFAALAAGADVVLGPARDGGYYLIGLGVVALRAALFEGIAWSTSAVLEQTLERCRAAGLAVALLPEEEDIDTGEALARFLDRLATNQLAACPRTAALVATWQIGHPPADGGRSERTCVS